MVFIPPTADLVAGFRLDRSSKTWILKQTDEINVLDDGIFESSRFHDNEIEIAGRVSSGFAGDAAIRSFGLRTRIQIDGGSIATGESVVVMNGDRASLENAGVLSAGDVAVEMSGDSARFKNFGVLLSTGLGIDLRGGEGIDRIQNFGVLEAQTGIIADGNFRFFNAESGVLLADKNVLKIDSEAGDHSSITNFGSMVSESNLFAVLGGDGVERFVNRGNVEGDINLGGGNDLFDSRLGTIGAPGAPHIITGGRGNDTYLVAEASLLLVEDKGAGHDTVKSSNSLRLGENFEDLFLLGKANINAGGNHDANRLHGNSGDNFLDGGAGHDMLTGGGGADIFFFRPDTGRDIVTDFHHDIDVIDLTEFDEIFKFDQLKDHMRQRGDDLLIDIGSDHIILKDTEFQELRAEDVLLALT